MKNYTATHLRSLLLYIMLFCVSLSGCVSTRYYESLPEARSGILAYHDDSDPEARRAVLVARRLLASRPIPVERVFIITSNLRNLKTGNQVFALEDNAGSLRCGEGKEPPDGCIYVGMKLIQELSDDALAGVLAHELGHLEKGHIGSNRVNTALGVYQYAPYLCTSNPNPAVTLIMCGLGLGISYTAYSVAVETAGMDRDIEREADRAAWDRLANSGYCAGRIMKTAFEELSKLKPEGGKSDIFSTHPSYSERWANADPSCGSVKTAKEAVNKQEYLPEKQKSIEEARVRPYEAQDSAAQHNLGVQYANGQGVPQDYAMARQWYERAAAQGYAVAQTNLGALYHNGQGAPQNYAMARQWYEKAAAQGEAMAQNNLGLLYHNGLGVPKDYVTARGWYEKAVAQGNALAQHNLGVLYEQGGQLTVFLKPRADQNAAPQPSERAMKVKLATVTDDRQEKGRIGTREAAFGISMGDVHLGQKAAETMQQALSDDLLAAGYRVVETGQDLIAEGHLRKFWVRTDTTILYWDVVGDIEFELAVLPATQKKEPVEKTFTCHQVERTYLYPSATLLGKVLDACLADMMLKVRADDIWKQAVNY